MRLVLAIISFVLAAVLIGFGIAQRTVFAGPDHITADVTTTSNATVTVIDGKTLNAFDRSQTIRASGADTIFAAYGRTSDVLAWVGESTSYNAITLDPETNELVSTLVSGTETEVPSPAGSDLWQADYTETKSLGFTINVPENISVIIVSDGVEPAPSKISVTWLLDNSAPFAGPLVIAGAVLLLLGLGFLLWAVNHIRKSRGPRRKQPKLPKVPKKPTYKPVKRSAQQPALPRGRRSAGMIAVPSILVGALLLSGCTSPTATLDDGTTVGATSTAAPEIELETPAVTEPQAKRIVSRIADAVAEADTTLDPELAATRLDGPALELRAGNYAIRKIVADYAVPVPIPASTVEITLPQQNDSWPRTVLAVVQDADATIAPQALVLIQDDPRSQYKVHYAVALAPGTVFPKVPPASIGTSRVAPDVKLFSAVPADIAAAYGDTLLLDAESEWWELFATEDDSLRVGVGKAAQDAKKAGTPSTAELIFENLPGEGQVVVLVTNDGGAIVATELAESETIRLLEVGAAANAQPDVAALLGKTSSTRGITANYSDQLLFYVPPAGSDDPIILLGYAQGLVSAVELP